jgi:hypothetical protein
MTTFAQHSLSSGWSFKDSDDQSSEAWLPVPVVPSVVQQDLQANGKYVLRHSLSTVPILRVLILFFSIGWKIRLLDSTS